MVHAAGFSSTVKACFFSRLRVKLRVWRLDHAHVGLGLSAPLAKRHAHAPTDNDPPPNSSKRKKARLCS